MKIIESTYRDYGHQFKFQVVGETETEYICKWIDNGEKIARPNEEHRIRKILIDNGLYKISNETEIVQQLSLFD